MQEPSLDGCRAKLDRADEHFASLYREGIGFLDEGGCDAVLNREANTGCWTVNFAVREPPLRLGVIVGDIAHNLRSALDHLVWQLVLTNGEEPGGWNQFPIFRYESDFASRAEPSPQKERMLSGISPEAVALIKGLQPFKAEVIPGLLPLSILKALSNVDKHRIVHTGFVSVSAIVLALGSGIEVTLPEGGTIVEERIFLEPRQRVEDGTEIARFCVEPPDATVQVDTDIPIDLIFEAEDSRATIQQLQVLCKRIREIVESFQRFFD
jgi:hypothetical protein